MRTPYEKFGMTEAQVIQMINELTQKLNEPQILKEKKKKRIEIGIRRDIEFLKTLFQLKKNEEEAYVSKFELPYKKVIQFNLSQVGDEASTMGVSNHLLINVLKRLKNKNAQNVSSGSSSAAEIDQRAGEVRVSSDEQSATLESPLTQKTEERTTPVNGMQVPSALAEHRTENPDTPNPSAHKNKEDREETKTSNILVSEHEVSKPTALPANQGIADKIIVGITGYLENRKSKNYGFFSRHFDFTRGQSRALIFKNLLEEYKDNDQAVNVIAYALLATHNGSKLKEAVADSLKDLVKSESNNSVPHYDLIKHFSDTISNESGVKKNTDLDAVINALVYSKNRHGEKLEAAKEKLKSFTKQPEQHSFVLVSSM